MGITSSRVSRRSSPRRRRSSSAHDPEHRARALLSLVVTLAVCEGLLRVFGAGVLPEARSVRRTIADVGKRMRPGWTGDEFEAPVTINSKGLRNPEIPYEKPANTYRILALGDSWTFGFRMNEPDAYPRQLERILQADAAARGDTRQHRGHQRRRRRLLDRPGGRLPRGRGLEVPARSRAGELLPGERHPQQAVQVQAARRDPRPAPVAARAVRVPARSSTCASSSRARGAR